MFDDFMADIQLAQVDNVRADGSIVLRLTNGSYALVPAEQVDIAKIASDSERAGKLAVVR